MKYVAVFSTFDSALVSQGDLLSLTEDGRLVHGYSGLDWHKAECAEILDISKNLTKLSKNWDGTFWAEVTLDSDTGEVTKSGLHRYDYDYCCGGYGNAKEVVEVCDV
jgi:hypothetical protein